MIEKPNIGVKKNERSVLSNGKPAAYNIPPMNMKINLINVLIAFDMYKF